MQTENSTQIIESAVREACDLSAMHESPSNTGTIVTDALYKAGYEIVSATRDTYNGWTNYATWRVNLEIVDEYINEINTYRRQCIRNGWHDLQTFESVIALADHLAEYCESIIDEQCAPESLANGYATAFLHQVNWYEIAQNYTTDNPELLGGLPHDYGMPCECPDCTGEQD